MHQSHTNIRIVLYIDDILLIEDNVKLLTGTKNWLAIRFKMKDLENTNYVLRIQILMDRKNRVLPLLQATYIHRKITRFSM